MRLARCLATCTTHTSHPPTSRCSPPSVRWPHPPSSGAGIFPPTSKRLVPSTARRLTSRPLCRPLARANSRPFPRRRVVPIVVCIYAFTVNTRAALPRFRLRGRHAGLECRNLTLSPSSAVFTGHSARCCHLYRHLVSSPDHFILPNWLSIEIVFSFVCLFFYNI